MKSIITVVLFLFCVNSEAQIAKFLNTNDALSPISSRLSGIAENQGTKFVVTFKNSTSTFEATIFEFNERLQTSNYKSIIFPNNFLISALQGIGFNSFGNMILVINSEIGSNATLNFYEINLNTELIVSTSTLLNPYKIGFNRFIQKGDSLIGCCISQSNELVRIAVSKENLSDYSETIIDTGISTFETLISNRKISDIQLGNGGIEYYVCTGFVYRRGLGGVISSAAINSSNNGVTLEFNGNEILVISNNIVSLFSENLLPLNSGTINVLLDAKFIEISYTSNTWLVYSISSGTETRTAFTSTDIVNATSNQSTNSYGFILQSERFNGNNYVLGHATQISAIALGINDELSPVEFLPASQQLSHNSISFYSGNKNSNFKGPQMQAGFIENNTMAGTIYNTSIGIIGERESNLEGVYSPYGSSDNPIYFGPYRTLNDLSFQNDDNYGIGYFVTKFMIDNHISNFNNPNYTAPFSIAQWPGNGDINIGHDNQVAPYFDANNNEIYEPTLGEYPLIYGDECLLNIYHQKPTPNQTTGIQVLQYQYYFNCPVNTVLESTIFVSQKFKAYNANIMNPYFSVFTDFDLGGPADDYIGTNVHLGMGYVYNADANDLNDGALGFGTNLPAQGAMILKGGKLTYDNLDNSYGIGSNQTTNGFGFEDGIIDNEYYTLESSLSIGSLFPNSIPTTIYQAYLASQGILSDGSFNTVSFTSTTVYYDFFGNSDPSFYASNGVDHGNNWTETNTGNPGGDRRMILGSKADNMIAADPLNNTTEIIVAYILAYNHTAPLADPVQDLFDKGQALKDLYASGQNSCGVSFDLQTSELNASVVEHFFDVKLFPNPTNSSLTIRLENNNFTYELSDLNGNKVLEGTSTSNSEMIDLGRMNAGIYFLNISQDGRLSRKKVVKM